MSEIIVTIAFPTEKTAGALFFCSKPDDGNEHNKNFLNHMYLFQADYPVRKQQC